MSLLEYQCSVNVLHVRGLHTKWLEFTNLGGGPCCCYCGGVRRCGFLLPASEALLAAGQAYSIQWGSTAKSADL